MVRVLKVALFTLVGATLVIGCSKKNNLAAEPQKNPPSIPMVDNKIDPEVKRTAMPALKNDLESKLIEKGLYTPDNCIQWVKLTKGEKEIGTYLEISATSCLSGEPVAEDDVLLRIAVKQHPQYFTQYRLFNEESGNDLGLFRRTESSGVVSYTLEAMCDLIASSNWENLGFQKECRVVIDGSSFRSPQPFVWYPE